MILSNRLKELRTETGISQRELAKAIGVNKSAVSFWENGTNEPKASYLLALSKFFNVSTDYLIGNTDEWGNAKEPGAIKKAPAITEDERELLALYKALSPERQRDIKVLTKSFASLDGANKGEKQG